MKKIKEKKKKKAPKKSLTQAQFYQAVADKFTEEEGDKNKIEYSPKVARRFIEHIMAVAYKHAGDERGVVIPGLGKLQLQFRPSRMARNPSNGEQVKTKPKWVVKIKPNKSCKDALLDN